MVPRFLNFTQSGTTVTLERLWKIKYIVISRAKHFHLSKKSREVAALKRMDAGLAWWSSGWESPANAGDTGLIRGPEDPTCCGATKPMCCNYGVRVPRAPAPQQEKPQQWDTHTSQLESRPHSLQLEKAHTAMKSQCRKKKRTMNKMEFQNIFNTKKDKKRTQEQRTERQTKRQMAKSKIQYW